ncbi:hypothetical protein [Streptomyces sp. T028]|uniref:hypothetical protein n=1 Tax=Streptomyces sp. T028 TaxID=3394379 RepID=UPI003A853EB3
MRRSTAASAVRIRPVVKPCHVPELVLRLRSPVRRRPYDRARALRAAGVEVDPAHRTVPRDGRRLDLSGKEFELPSALAPCPGVSRDRGTARA